MNKLIEKSNGANFYKADLHLHTPFDKGFIINRNELVNGDKQVKKEFVRAYLDKVMEKELQIIAITEHNDAAWIEYFQEVNKEDKYKELIIFPSLEITSKEAIHLHVLFNPMTKTAVYNSNP